VGNETREVGETAGRAQVNGVESDRVIDELAHTARTEDPTRLSVYASHHRAEDARNFHTEVLAFNKYFGWYSGKAEDFAGWADGVHQRYPALRFGMSEYGAGANPAHHDLSLKKPVPGGEWHPEEYQAHYHEVHWLAMRERPFLWGKFIWNLFDFASDNRHEGAAPGMNDKGLVSYDRKLRKDAFYFYKASWNPEPMVYLAGRRQAERPVGETEIKVYSNSPRVELFLNGVSQGVVTSDTAVLRWKVALAAGPNRVEAHAGGLADSCTIAGVPPPSPPAKSGQ
jgi:beta-galactosidase